MASNRQTFTAQTASPTPLEMKKAGSYIRGVKVFFNVTAVPGADTVTLNIRFKDPASATYVTALASTARSTTGMEVLTIYPDVAAAANVSVNDVLPDDYQVQPVHSGSGAFTYTVSVVELG